MNEVHFPRASLIFFVLVLALGLFALPAHALSSNAAAGDVFAVKSAHFPAQSLNAAQSRVVTIVMADYRESQSPIEIQLNVYDDKGNLVIGPLLVQSKAGAITTNEFDVDPLPSTLETGKTYSLVVRVAPGLGELVLGNNSATALFAVIQAPQEVSVPDNSPWASAFTLTIVLGWLFVSVRKK